MGSRKKADIQKDWDKATVALDAAIKAYKPSSESKLATVHEKYAAWKKLLDEAVAKVAKWDEGQTGERANFQGHVKTQQTQTDPRYVKTVHDCEGELVEDEIASQVAQIAGKVDGFAKDVANIRTLLGQQGQASAAMQKIGALETAINKQFLSFKDEQALKARFADAAKVRKVDIKYVDMNRSDIRNAFTKIATAYKQASVTTHELTDMAEAILEKEAEHAPFTGKNPNDQLKFKKIWDKYKGVIDFMKQELDVIKAEAPKASPLEASAMVIVPEKVPQLVHNIAALWTSVDGRYNKVAQHFQDTIRTGTSKFAAEAAKELEKADRDKLAPFTNRGITFNLQASTLRDQCHTHLQKALQTLVSKHNNADAAKALQQMAH